MNIVAKDYLSLLNKASKDDFDEIENSFPNNQFLPALLNLYLSHYIKVNFKQIWEENKND